MSNNTDNDDLNNYMIVNKKPNNCKQIQNELQ